MKWANIINYQLYTEKKFELKLAQFVSCIASYRSSVSMFQRSAKKNWNIICLLDIKLYVFFSPSYPSFMPLKHQHVVWIRLASVISKRNNELMIHCYVWVPEMLMLHNGSLIHCYVWVRQFWSYSDFTFTIIVNFMLTDSNSFMVEKDWIIQVIWVAWRNEVQS